MAVVSLILFVSGLLGISHVRAQVNIPLVLPGNWTSVGCFTDISTSRTLAAATLVQNTMTIETCIQFCTAQNYIFAGLEFSDECYCDSAMQIPSQPAALNDCTMPCSGKASESCGGPNRVYIFNSNLPPPIIVPSVVVPQQSGGGLWSYSGCFTDTVLARTLGTGINIPGGTTAESCTAACQAAGGFQFAGLENGHECWCDNAIHAPTQHVGDADCRMVCSTTHTEFCGNQNRVAIYQFSASGKAPGPQACLQTNLSNFTLKAQFKNPPMNGGPMTVALKVVVVEMVKNVLWTILSACPLCCSEWPSMSMQNSIITPHSMVVPRQEMASTSTKDGETPGFVASIPAFPGFQAYCTMTDPLAPLGSNAPPLLAFNGQPDAFSLCTNTSVNANARVDLVFSPVTGHPNYMLDQCEPVRILVVT